MIQPLITFNFPSTHAAGTMPCPCCRIERVAEPEASFSATQVTIEYCAPCTSRTAIASVTITKSALAHYLDA
jgi:hypothetical protein